MKMNEQQERESTFHEYLRVLIGGRWIIIISFITVFGFVAYYTFTATPIYKATAKVMFKENAAAERTFFSFSSFGEKEKMINNQVEIITSRTLAEKVIRKLQASKYADKLVLLGNLPEGQRGKGLGIRTTIKKAVKGILGNIIKRKSDGESQLVDQEELEFNSYVQNLLESISIDPIRNTDVVEVSVVATSPFEASYLTNVLAETYQRENQLENQAEVRRVKDFLAEQLDVVQQQLSESEIALKDYMENQKVVALPTETQELISRIAEFESLYRGSLLELESAKERLVYVNEQLTKNSLNFNTDAIFANPYIEEVTKQIAEIESKRAIFIANLINQGLYDEENPTVKEYNERIKLLTDKIKMRTAQLASTELGDPLLISENLMQRKIELEATLQALKPKVESLSEILRKYNAELESIPEKSLRLARLERAAKLDEKITLMMKEKYEESRITEVGQLGNVRIIDPAKAPLYPIKPKTKMNLILGIILGLGLGLGTTFLLEYFDNSVRSIEDVERLRIPTLGAIPLIKLEEAVSKYNKMHGEAKPGKTTNARLVTHFAPKSPISEAYRSLRTSIQFSRVDGALRTLVVTSPGPQEGKSTTVSNLAITMAQMGSKVLLVDTDLRRPVLHSIFGVSRAKGISNYLIGKIPIEEAILETGIDNLYLMPSGTLPPNPSELLGSSAMQECIDRLKEKFDLVIFDSPPIIAVTDSAIISTKVDGVILVIKAGQTNRYALERAYNTIFKIAGRKMLGALLNVVNVEGTYGSYYYYYYHYYYGKTEDKKKAKEKKSLTRVS
ncbi:polysaccharide biosynthesis tyrosine autokinase [candidate division KSB1 bacterium]|nr:polysaccharide biosynthesis tyrosine autokinase [candidate division KSB1 bacterium]